MTDLNPEADSFDAEVDAARSAEQDDQQQDAPQQRDEGAEAEESGEQARPKPGLSVEELDKRYRSSRTALSQEREARRELERRLAALESARTAPEQRQATDNAPPDPTVDPIGAIQWQNEQIQRQQRAEQERQAQTAQERQQQESVNRLVSWGREQEDDFRTDNADYDQAAQHFASERIKELAAMGVPQNELANALNSELLTLTQRAQSQRMNPAEAVYKLAQLRGYKRGEAKQSTRDDLQRVANGQAQNRSLSSSGGRPVGGGDLTPGKVADLHGSAFDKAFEQLKAREKRRA